MEYQKYIEQNINLQDLFLKYIDDGSENNIYYHDLLKKLDSLNLSENKHILDEILRFISNVSQNYHRSTDFFTKIENVLLHLSENIKKSFPNEIIYNFFYADKRILLFLIKKNIITLTEPIVKNIVINHGVYF